jgi:hypothetical protein
MVVWSRHGKAPTHLRSRRHKAVDRFGRNPRHHDLGFARRHRALGFDRAGITQTINGIGKGMFYKSMTTFADHRLWQDVYHVPSRGLTLYIKFQADVVTEFSVVSFKEK